MFKIIFDKWYNSFGTSSKLLQIGQCLKATLTFLVHSKCEKLDFEEMDSGKNFFLAKTQVSEVAYEMGKATQAMEILLSNRAHLCVVGIFRFIFWQTP